MPLGFPTLQMSFIIPELEEGSHLVNVHPGCDGKHRWGERRVPHSSTTLSSAVHSAMRRHFLKSLGLRLVFILNSSRSSPNLSAVRNLAAGAAAASEGSSSGAAAASHSCRRIILVNMLLREIRRRRVKEAGISEQPLHTTVSAAWRFSKLSAVRTISAYNATGVMLNLRVCHFKNNTPRTRN